jgi:hypothetical protein
MIFRRPELEKDNPIAPQPYVGPRRRLAMARAAALGELTEVEDVRETLQLLTEAASRVANGQSAIPKTDKSLKALRAAIVQAERVLLAEGRSKP